MKCSSKRKHLFCKNESIQKNDCKSLAKKGEVRFYNSSEEGELARLQEPINRTGTEKCYHLMTLMKLQRAMQKTAV